MVLTPQDSSFLSFYVSRKFISFPGNILCITRFKWKRNRSSLWVSLGFFWNKFFIMIDSKTVSLCVFRSHSRVECSWRSNKSPQVTHHRDFHCLRNPREHRWIRSRFGCDLSPLLLTTELVCFTSFCCSLCSIFRPSGSLGGSQRVGNLSCLQLMLVYSWGEKGSLWVRNISL